MHEGLECLLSGSAKRPKIEFDANWQETSDAPCDTGSPISTIQNVFPQYKDELSKVDPAFTSKTGPYAFTRSATLSRGQTALKALYSRPEKVIAVVSHAGFLRTAISQCHFTNADYRIFDFADDVDEGKEIRLRERKSTEEKGGGMGKSWKGIATLEEGDFPPEQDILPRDETPPPTPPECFGKKVRDGRI